MQFTLRQKRVVCYVFIAFLIGILASLPVDAQRSLAQSTPGVPSANFDAETQQLIAQADHVIFLIPFSHWDTDWHDTFAAYSQLADQNIINAIE
jgi:hypothetical protein